MTQWDKRVLLKLLALAWLFSPRNLETAPPHLPASRLSARTHTHTHNCTTKATEKYPCRYHEVLPPLLPRSMQQRKLNRDTAKGDDQSASCSPAKKNTSMTHGKMWGGGRVYGHQKNQVQCRDQEGRAGPNKYQWSGEQRSHTGVCTNECCAGQTVVSSIAMQIGVKPHRSQGGQVDGQGWPRALGYMEPGPIKSGHLRATEEPSSLSSPWVAGGGRVPLAQLGLVFSPIQGDNPLINASKGSSMICYRALLEPRYHQRVPMWLNLWHPKRTLEPLGLALWSQGRGREGGDSSIQRPRGPQCDPESKLHSQRQW